MAYQNDYYTTTLCHLDDTDDDEGEWVATIDHKGLYTARFNLTNFKLFKIPSKLKVIGNYQTYHALNMRCNVATNGFPKMCNRSGYTCWCKLIDKLLTDGKGRVKIILLREKNEDNLHMAYGMIVNAYVINKNVPRDKMRVNLELSFTYNSKPVDYNTTFNYPIMVRNQLKNQIIGSDEVITQIKFKFDLDQEFPRYFEVTNHDTIYRTSDNFTCHYDPQKPCPSEKGNECFCTLINQIRTNGSGLLKVDLIPYKSKTTYVLYKMLILGVRDQKDPNCLHVTVEFLYT